jgi:hypothetical protein
MKEHHFLSDIFSKLTQGPTEIGFAFVPAYWLLIFGWNEILQFLKAIKKKFQGNTYLRGFCAKSEFAHVEKNS